MKGSRHFDVEVDMAGLHALANEHYEARRNIEGYLLPNGRTVFALAEGRLVNIAAGDGHPAEIMDMSFAIQARSAEWLIRNRDVVTSVLNNVPREVDLAVASQKLASMNIEIDTLTDEQRTYLFGGDSDALL